MKTDGVDIFKQLLFISPSPQLDLVQESTAGLESIRARVETLDPLKNLVVRNSEAVTNLDSLVAGLQTDMNTNDNVRRDMKTKHSRLHRNYEQLR